MVNKLSSQEYVDIIYHNTILPLELCEKIISYIYTFTFKTKLELKKAIMKYPDNINIYGNCNNWDVSNIRDMSNLFIQSNFDNEICNWNVSNVIDMTGMFRESEFNKNINSWDICSVKYTDFMFYKSKYTGKIDNWDNKNVLSSYLMFYRSNFKEGIPKWKDIDINTMKTEDRTYQIHECLQDFLNDASDDEDYLDDQEYFEPFHNEKCKHLGLGLCCKENLKLKENYPKITENISVEETLKLLKIIREKYSGFNLGINITIEKCIDIFILNSNNADIIIKKLNECNCCEHHKKNKPKKLDDVEWKKNVPLYKVSEKMELLIFNSEDNEKCNCFCRHYSRIIQSTFNV